MSFALGAAGLGLVIAGDDVTAFLLSGHADAAMIATAGAVLSRIILQRRPRHPIGWGAVVVGAVAAGLGDRRAAKPTAPRSR